MYIYLTGQTPFFNAANSGAVLGIRALLKGPGDMFIGINHYKGPYCFTLAQTVRSSPLLRCCCGGI